MQIKGGPCSGLEVQESPFISHPTPWELSGSELHGSRHTLGHRHQVGFIHSTSNREVSWGETQHPAGQWGVGGGLAFPSAW